MKFVEISNALETHLIKLPDIPPVTFENVSPKTPPKGAFFMVKNLPKQSQIDTLGCTEVHSGIFSINIYTSAGSGRATAEKYADLLHEHFFNQRFGGLLTSTVSRSQGLVTDTHYVINVSVIYQTME